MATSIAIDGEQWIRFDDRQSTFGNTEFFECSPDVTILPPGVPRFFGTVLIGLTSTGAINGPLVMRTMEVWNFGVHLHRSQLFPGGLPSGYENLLWDVWFRGRGSQFVMLVAGVQP